MNAGDRVRVDRTGTTYEGVLLPSTTNEELVVKLDGGYNVGIDRADASVEIVDRDTYDIAAAGDAEGDSEITFDDNLPTIALIS
ncbi:MAG: Glu-tRNA(Gln) amidotransferase GatDE subunit D, partial [Natronomonas sp.]|nr:Glu-tRNA(Gln) amidotransferase GatDE subunit D [Natronomonas sp.]